TATGLVWLLVFSAVAQQAPPRSQPPAQQPQDDQPKVLQATKGISSFSSSTTLVVEDVTLKDKSGNPIKGLTAKDFIITEDGKPQVVKSADFQTLEETAAEPAPLAPRPDAVAEAA